MSEAAFAPVTRDIALRMDVEDPLAAFRDRFVPTKEGELYMDGNSLGRQPKDAGDVVTQVLADWRDGMILAWREWIRVPQRVGDAIAQSVVEAKPGEVIVGDSTSVNLYKAAAAAVGAQVGRRTLLTSDDNFPTDMYALQSLAAQHSLQLKVLHADPVEGLDLDVLRGALGADVALLALSHVAYRSGALLDMTRVTRMAHDCGALVLWDVSHSAGSVRVPLETSGADLAVGCTYKYLNGGPGSPAFGYVRRDLQERVRQPIQGWMGRRDPFEMGPGYTPATGVRGIVSGTPPILATVPLLAGLDMLEEAGIAAVRAKSRALTAYALELVDAWLPEVEVVSPRDPDRRGGHLTIRRPGFREILDALWDAGVIPDFREPDNIRLGLAPLSTSFIEVHDGLAVLRDLLAAPPCGGAVR